MKKDDEKKKQQDKNKILRKCDKVLNAIRKGVEKQTYEFTCLDDKVKKILYSLTDGEKHFLRLEAVNLGNEDIPWPDLLNMVVQRREADDQTSSTEPVAVAEDGAKATPEADDQTSSTEPVAVAGGNAKIPAAKAQDQTSAAGGNAKIPAAKKTGANRSGTNPLNGWEPKENYDSELSKAYKKINVAEEAITNAKKNLEDENIKTVEERIKEVDVEFQILSEILCKYTEYIDDLNTTTEKKEKYLAKYSNFSENVQKIEDRLLELKIELGGLKLEKKKSQAGLLKSPSKDDKWDAMDYVIWGAVISVVVIFFALLLYFIFNKSKKKIEIKIQK